MEFIIGNVVALLIFILEPTYYGRLYWTEVIYRNVASFLQI